MPGQTETPTPRPPSGTEIPRAESEDAPAAVPPPRSRPARPAPPRRTLWEEGQHPGRLVVRAALVVLTLATLIDLAFGNRIGVVFDVAFVLICLAAGLWVRPRDFFTVGVLPPLLLAGAVLVLAVLDRGAVAKPDDPILQAVVSGLAHHALALVIGYALTLGVLALRQVALRHHGALRAHKREPQGH